LASVGARSAPAKMQKLRQKRCSSGDRIGVSSDILFVSTRELVVCSGVLTAADQEQSKGGGADADVSKNLADGPGSRTLLVKSCVGNSEGGRR